MHYDNYTKTVSRNVLSEIFRQSKEYKNWVDSNSTQYNFSLIERGNASEQMTLIDKRCDEITNGKKLQDQTNVMTSVITTYPKSLCYEETYTDNKGETHTRYVPNDYFECRIFFSEVLDFLSQRYGRDNVVCAEVHMDETTPHLHFGFVPEAVSRKTNKKTVSSASLITRRELTTVHRELQKHMNKIYGNNDYILNGNTKGDYTIAEIKERDEKEIEYKRRVKKLEDDEKKLEDEKKKLEDEKRKLENDKIALKRTEMLLNERLDVAEDIITNMSEKAKNDVSVRSAYDTIKNLRNKSDENEKKKSTEKVICTGFGKHT